MWHSTALTAAVLALASWIVLCLVAQPPRIEEALRLEATRALADAHLPDVRAVFSGRDATLEGLVATPALIAEAESAVSAVAGVRVVASQLTVREIADEAIPSYFEIRTRPGGVTLRGTVPSDERRLEVLERARQAYGLEAVEERLAVDAAVEDGAALAGAPGVIDALASVGDEVKVRLRGDSLRLSGTVADAESRRRIEDRVRAAVPEVRLFFSALRAGPDPGLASGEEGG